MKLLDDLADVFRKRKEDALQRYRTLLSRADNPKRGDDAELLEVMDKLGIDAERVAVDYNVLKRIAELEVLAATLEEKREKHKSAGRNLHDFYEVERAQVMEQLNARAAELENAKGKAEVAFTEAARAVDELTELKKKHAALLGIVPASAA